MKLAILALLLCGCATNIPAEASTGSMLAIPPAIRYVPTPEPQNRPVEAPEPYVIDITDQLEHPAVRYDVWREIVAAFGPEHAECAAIIAGRESRFRTDAVGLLGEQGMFQVRAKYHGPVPRDVPGQVRQAARIHAASGFAPWSTRGSC